MFEKYLEEIGLSDKEAAVYIALLQAEHDSVANIADKAKIKRTTVYPTLESLAKKGLVSEVILEKKTNYRAESPERLNTYIEKRKVEIEEKGRRLKDIIPELKNLKLASGDKPAIKYFEGKDGVLSSFEDFFQEEDLGEAFFAYPRDLVKEVFTEEEQNSYKKTRLSNSVLSKIIYTSTTETLGSDQTAKRTKIDGKKYPLYADIAIHGDKVRINTLKGKFTAILITNKEVADTLKSLFGLLFEKLNNES